MRKHGINPHPRTEEERRQIQQQLSMRPMGPQAGAIPQYFLKKKEAFLQQAANMGFDLYQVQDFLESKGLPEMQLNNLVDNLNNPQYMNVLKVQQMMMPQ